MLDYQIYDYCYFMASLLHTYNKLILIIKASQSNWQE